MVKNNLFRLTPVVSTAIVISTIAIVSTVSISVGISIISISISISTTLATDNTLVGVASWVKLTDSVNSSVIRKTKTNPISIRSIAITKISWLSISTTLANSLRRPGYKGGSSTGMSSNSRNKGTESITISIRTKSITVSKVSWLSVSISATLANITTAAKAGGLCVRSGDSWPVRVGIKEGRCGNNIPWVSFTRDSGGHGQTGGPM